MKHRPLFIVLMLTLGVTVCHADNPPPANTVTAAPVQETLNTPAIEPVQTTPSTPATTPALANTPAATPV
ncbi:hypothetical protein DOJK_01332 [Patescibacteria group bacterium]|nr:hypothetical protein DOJK_01332 [Patescibacteria group bacterium]